MSLAVAPPSRSRPWAFQHQAVPLGVVLAGVGLLSITHAAIAATTAVAISAALWLWDPGPDGWRAPMYLVLSFLPVSTVLTLLLGTLAGGISRPVAWSPLWREATVFAVLALAAVGVTVGLIRFRVLAEDWLLLAFVCLVVTYAALGLGNRGPELSLFQRALGARSWLLPAACYLIGRFTPQGAVGHERDLALIIRLAWFVAVTGFVEFFLLGDRFWQQLDYAQYLSSTGTPASGIFNGVMYNFYSPDHAGVMHRRWPALMGTLTVGYWYLGTLPVIAAAAWTRRSKGLLALLLVAAVALVGSRTRAAIGSLGLALGFLALLHQHKRRWIVIGIGALLGGLAALNVDPRSAEVLARWLRLPIDPSAFAHIAAIVYSARLVVLHPLGFGIGSSASVGMAFADQNAQVIGESLYLSLAADLGWLGATLFVGWALLAAVRLGRFALHDARRDSRWVLAAGLAAATVGYLVASVTTELWRGLQAGALYWWLLGTAVTMCSASRE